MEDRNTSVNSDGILDKRLEEIAQKRKELQNVEIELKAQALARSEVLNLEGRFQSKINEYIDAASILKDQLKESQQHIQQLEMKLVEMDRELHAVKLDNEAAWAKDDLLREQNKELATFRRELDNSEAERAQRLQQMHDFQEHIQEKENRILQLEEQNRVAQETILFKDEKLREAQSWVARLQEMDALQSTALHAQLRDRTEQFNQYWIGLHRQFAEVERHHLQTIQQLQLELAEARKQNGVNNEGTIKSVSHNSVDSSSSVHNKGNQINNVDASNGNLVTITNDNLNGLAPSASGSKTGSTVGVTIATSPMVGLIPHNQLTAALHPFVIHPQGLSQSVSSSSSSQIPQFVGHFQPVSAISAHQHWQLQQLQALPDGSQNPIQNKHQPAQIQQNHSVSDFHHSYDNHVNQQQQSTSINGSSDKENLSHASDGVLYQEPLEPQASSVNGPQQKPNAVTSFQPSLVFASPIKRSVIAGHEQMVVSDGNRSQDQHLASTKGEPSPDESKCSNNAANNSEKKERTSEGDSIKWTANSAAPTQPPQPALLDERTLLGCIVRAIPLGADKRIRISTTLPNRLGKMLAPLHWHDYKKQYGKLDDFVARHPELFVIEDDFVHLREGAHEVISATTAKAKVAASSSSGPYTSTFHSVALTPMSQNNSSKIVASQQQSNGASFSVAQGMSTLNISDKSEKYPEVNGLLTKKHATIAGANKGSTYANISIGAKQQARSTGAGVISRR